jgi:BirA family biotin operon repressor/biotin-[acetyl-CoA-carboxylase] ligase
VPASEVEAHLEGPARSWVRDVRAFAQVESTNDVLKRAAREGAPEGTVAIAQVQTAGRGRQGRAWVSPPGNLFLSILVRPRNVTVSLLPLAAGVAVAEALARRGAACRVKWPNDVLVGERKLAGLLAEASSGAAGVESVVLGIGANVNLTAAEVPEELREVVTSLREESGREHDVAEVAAEVLGCWVHWYDALHGDGRRVRQGWRERSVDWWDRPIELSTGGQRLVGIARDIDDAGALIVETEDGARIAVVSGEAQQIRPR